MKGGDGASQRRTAAVCTAHGLHFLFSGSFVVHIYIHMAYAFGEAPVELCHKILYHLVLCHLICHSSTPSVFIIVRIDSPPLRFGS